MARYFIFMFVEDKYLRRYLDLAIYALNPRERWPAHVTMAGPFDRKIEVPRSLTFAQTVSVFGRGRFDSGKHHTVFLHVGSKDMAARIDKPDYKNAVPHLSLYNGKDAPLADEFYERLGPIRPFGTFPATKLHVVESRQQLNFNFQMHVDTALLDRTRGMTLDDIKGLNRTERADIAIDAIGTGFERPFNLGRVLEAR